MKSKGAGELFCSDYSSSSRQISLADLKGNLLRKINLESDKFSPTKANFHSHLDQTKKNFKVLD